MNKTHRQVPVVESSQVAEARRAAIECATEIGLGETATAKAALVTTELATNLVKHGDGGAMLFGQSNDAEAITIIAFDKGRGIANVPAALRDGYSTAGSAGTGLGAISRASTSFDVYAVEDGGTAVLCRLADDVRPSLTPSPLQRMNVGGICVPKPTEEQSGDSWMSVVTRDTVTIAIIDGLGHGPLAAEASTAAVRVFREHVDESLDQMLQEAHGVLRPTRGAAVGIARIHMGQNRLDFAGVGNIAGTIATDDAMRRVVSLNGIVGHEMRKVQIFSYPWSASSILILQSDGISANWNAATYPGLLRRDPTLIAAVLYRDHCRGTDDATVVVAKAS